MRTPLLFGLVALLGTGCAVTWPRVSVEETGTNGVVTKKKISLPAFVVWPGTQTLEKQRGSIGKTLSAGFSDAAQEGGGTNVVEALRALDSILGKIR
jgi:hypothetical protein